MKTESLLIGLFAGLLSTNIYALGEATQTPVWAEEITPLDSHWGGSNANNLPNHPEYGRLAFMNDTSQTEANGLYVVNPHGPTEHSNAVWSKVAVDLGCLTFEITVRGAMASPSTIAKRFRRPLTRPLKMEEALCIFPRVRTKSTPGLRSPV